MNTRLLPALLALCLLSLLVACGGSEPEPQTVGSGDCTAPAWFLDPPQDDNYFLSAQTAVSQQLQTAIDKAKTNGRLDLAARVETHVEGLYSQFTEDIGTETESRIRQKYEQGTKQIVDRALNGSNSRHTQYCREAGGYRAFVLMELPVGEANEEVMRMISREEELYTEFKASQFFEEMERKLEQYRQQQGR